MAVQRLCEAVSGSRLEEHNRLRVSWKSCLNLSSHRLLKPSLNLASNLTPSRLRIESIGQQVDLMKCKRDFLNCSLEVELVNLSTQFVPFSRYMTYQSIFDITVSASHNWVSFSDSKCNCWYNFVQVPLKAPIIYFLTATCLPHSQPSTTVKGKPYQLNVNHCISYTDFDPKVTVSLEPRLGPKARLTT